MNIIDYIGFNGPILLIFIHIFSLWKQKKYLYTYLFFIFVNKYINKILKFIIKQDRPFGYNINHEYKFLEYKGVEKYGMPSGHSQSIFFSTAYAWFVKKSPLLLFFDLFVCALTVYQRWKNNRHTFKQLFVGAIIGTLVAFFAYSMIRRIYNI